MGTGPRLDPELGYWPGICEQPVECLADLACAGLTRQIPVGIFDGRLQAIQRSKEILEPQAVDDYVVVAEPVSVRQFPS